MIWNLFLTTDADVESQEHINDIAAVTCPAK